MRQRSWLRWRDRRKTPRPDLRAGETALQLALSGSDSVDPTFWSKRAAGAFHRAAQFDDDTALDEAILCWRIAVAAATTRHLDRAAYMNYLMVAYRDRFVRAGSKSDLDAAIALGEEVVRITPSDDPARAMYLSNLSQVHRMHFQGGG